jgi:CBS domain-containing protein
MHKTEREVAEGLGDFTATPRLLTISLFAVGIGVVGAYVARGLLTLIGLFTNLFFFQRFSTALVTPVGHTLGPLVIVVPIVGALIIGVMARYGSERIRGHGIPEAIEAILINGSRVVARRGFHLSREYAIDPLEILFVREVMRTSVAALRAGAPFDQLAHPLHGDATRRRQRLYPVIGDQQELVGVVTRNELQTLVDRAPGNAAAQLTSIMRRSPVVAHPDESLRVVVYRMAETGLTRFPVVDRTSRRLLGMIALTDLLKARALTLDAEHRRERVLGTRIAMPFRLTKVTTVDG